MQEIVARNTGGDPMNEIKWLSTSTRNIANELKKFGHLTSHVTVNRMLHDRGYTLRSNSKNKEGKSHPDRNNQFEIINSLVDAFLSENSPVISVDTKKKEKVGNFKNFGKKSEAKEKPTLVSVYDYPSLSSGSAIPYGTYDVFRNEGFVNIGTSYDTAEFAVQSIDYWWKFLGKKNYKNAKKILICADGGGSNGSRNRAWKKNLQGFSNKSGLEITVAHYPPATSKWNKIEHRLFSFISLNWRGQPLTSYEIIVNLIGATKPKEGLRVDTNLDFFAYKRGIKVSDKELENLNIAYCERFPRWNYTIFPKKNEKK